MNDRVQFSDVQFLNLTLLIAAQALSRKDPVKAAYKYNLSVEQVRKVAELGTEDIQGLVANFGNECLFVPRHDFIKLLEAPLPLLNTLSAVSVPDVALAPARPGERR